MMHRSTTHHTMSNMFYNGATSPSSMSSANIIVHKNLLSLLLNTNLNNIKTNVIFLSYLNNYC